jgi:hypothetical protein
MKRKVWDLAHGRSGDKGDICNMGLIARSPAAYAVLKREVTADRVKQHFGGLIKGAVERFELPNIQALNFVCRGALNGGGTLSLRSDHLGKVMYAWLLRMEIEDA